MVVPDDRGADFDRNEEIILRDLAAIDARFARRAHLDPSEADRSRVTMAAVLHEDATLALVDGAIDPFSFDARDRGLAAALAKTNALPHDGAHATERELLVRVVDSEIARLDDERQLPRSASALVRAVVEGWQTPRDEREAGEADRWLAKRLGLVRASMKSARLDVVRARDLDDALDALEGRARRLIATTQEIVQLRDALEEAGAAPAAGAASTWTLVGPRLRAELGPTATAESLARELAETEKVLRARASKALGEGQIWTDKELFVFGPCVDAVAGARVPSIAAPPEREAGCRLRHFVAEATDEARVLSVLLDHVVIAAWALDVARGASTLQHAEGEHHLFIAALPHVRSRYERIAVTRPVAAILAGMTARLLAADPAARAKAWGRFGEVPLDVAARGLH